MKIVAIEDENVKPKVVISEFKALYECKNNNIIQLYDAFYREGSLYMIIEYMNCGSLADIIKYTKTIPEAVLSKITKEVKLKLTKIDFDRNNIPA
jgi:serine/threonine protein kinase